MCVIFILEEKWDAHVSSFYTYGNSEFYTYSPGTRAEICGSSILLALMVHRESTERQRESGFLPVSLGTAHFLGELLALEHRGDCAPT